MTSNEALASLVAECNGRGGGQSDAVIVWTMRTLAGWPRREVRVLRCRYCGEIIGTGRDRLALGRRGVIHQGYHVEERMRREA